MDIKLYHNSSPNNKVNKSLSSETVLSGSLRDESRVINPEVLIESSTPLSFNYVYIPSFHRYYYIRDIVAYRTNLWLLKLDVDVLMSYKEDILDLNCIISDTEEYKGDDYLSTSPSWISKVKAKTSILTFNGSSLLSDGAYILITAGG